MQKQNQYHIEVGTILLKLSIYLEGASEDSDHAPEARGHEWSGGFLAGVEHLSSAILAGFALNGTSLPSMTRQELNEFISMHNHHNANLDYIEYLIGHLPSDRFKS